MMNQPDVLRLANRIALRRSWVWSDVTHAEAAVLVAEALIERMTPKVVIKAGTSERDADASIVAHLRSISDRIANGKSTDAELSDAEVAGRVRMLTSSDPDNEIVCVMGRDRIIALSNRTGSVLNPDTVAIRRQFKDAPHADKCPRKTSSHLPGFTHYETDACDSCPPYHFGSSGACNCWKSAFGIDAILDRLTAAENARVTLLDDNKILKDELNIANEAAQFYNRKTADAMVLREVAEKALVAAEREVERLKGELARYECESLARPSEGAIQMSELVPKDAVDRLLAAHEKAIADIAYRDAVLAERSKYPIPVVCALIVRDGKVLLERHAPSYGHTELFWDIPGGKIEITDTSGVDAVKREIREEMGVEIEVLRTLPRLDISVWADKSWTLTTYECRIVSGEPPLSDELEWLEIDRLGHYDVKSPDLEIITNYQCEMLTLAKASYPGHYISTACQAGLHEQCRVQSKWADDPCLCACGHAGVS